MLPSESWHLLTFTRYARLLWHAALILKYHSKYTGLVALRNWVLFLLSGAPSKSILQRLSQIEMEEFL